MMLTIHIRRHNRTIQRVTYCVKHHWMRRRTLAHSTCAHCLAVQI